MSIKINIRKLASQFKVHVAELKSAPFACSMETALEDWFKVETLPVLESMGFQNFDLKPQIGRGRADLRVRSKGRSILFEFMSLVEGADSNKLKRYPKQIDRLEREVNTGKITQGICFLLLFGYTVKRERNIRERNIIQKLFRGRNWDTIGPLNVISDHRRRMFLGSYS